VFLYPNSVSLFDLLCISSYILFTSTRYGTKDAMAERLRIKAELKKKASKPMGYKESMEAEKNKQKSLQKTKEEQRAAMCEELGRGC